MTSAPSRSKAVTAVGSVPVAVVTPRGLHRYCAAAYIGLGATKFDQLVADGRMPQPRRIDGRKVWDRHELDDAFSALPHDEETNPWDALTA